MIYIVNSKRMVIQSGNIKRTCFYFGVRFCLIYFSVASRKMIQKKIKNALTTNSEILSTVCNILASHLLGLFLSLNILRAAADVFIFQKIFSVSFISFGRDYESRREITSLSEWIFPRFQRHKINIGS